MRRHRVPEPIKGLYVGYPLRNAIVAVLVSVFISAAVASAQTGSSPPSGLVAAPSEAGRFTISAEALLWWFKGSPAPVPLVSNGLLDEVGTKVLLGGKDLDTNPNSGFRVTVGYSLTDRWGAEGSLFYLVDRSTSRTASSSGQIGSQDLFIPFFDVTAPGENVTELSRAGFFAGSAKEELNNSFLGAELNGTMKLLSAAPWRVDLLGGLRYLNLRETYTFTTSSPNIPPQPADVFQTKDEFDATNNFYGAQLGVRARYDRGSWFANSTVKFALGAMVQSVDIDGFLETNDFNDFGPVQRFAGGYFAQPTNIGRHSRSVFAVVPEVGLNIGYRITEWVSVFAGYTFLYTNSVVRPAQQIDRNINPTQNASFEGSPPTPLVGPAQPSFKFHSSDFWAQGLNVGLAFRF
ncbi:MAG: BBP7 family outer membrane beta-barrel protein [candidate division NC10 bacterium]|nr:BBP7 family outer membrane beta-barrel protein [candidate division NC10 bacterium]